MIRSFIQIVAIFALYCLTQVALVNGNPWQPRPRTFAGVTLRPKGAIDPQQGTNL